MRVRKLNGASGTGSYTILIDQDADNDAAINPGAVEVCGDGIDQDCSGADEVCAIITFENGYVETRQSDGVTTIMHKNYGARAGQQTSDGGYIMLGYVRDWGGDPYINTYTTYLVKTSANGAEQWRKTYNGEGRSIQEIAGGGHIILTDSALIKTDSNGDQIWSQAIGGNFVRQTSDGGYIILSNSALIKTNASGIQDWINDTIGGNCVRQTTDGGYIVLTSTALIKTDAGGVETWNQPWSQPVDGYIEGKCVQQTTDGGYIMVGDRIIGDNGDAYIIKTDAVGNETWHKTFGGLRYEYANYVQQTADGGYIITGLTESFVASSIHECYNAYLLKLNSDGSQAWYNTYLYTDNPVCDDHTGYYAQQTSDGGYVMMGYSKLWSWTDQTEIRTYMYLVKTDADGNSSRARTYYHDADGDSYGDPNDSTATPVIIRPAGYVPAFGDCNDCNANEYITYYQDADGDSYGNPAVTQCGNLTAPAGYVLDNTDCDDADANAHPGGIEVCDGIDNDCNDGIADEICNVLVPQDYPTIQSAIDAVTIGGTVLVSDGTYYENINMNNKTITMRSVNGAASTTIDGGGNGSVITMYYSGGEINGFTITNGSSGAGGGISVSYDSVTIINCAITGNTASYGGGICAFAYYGFVTIDTCTVNGNTATVSGGGLYSYYSTPTLIGIELITGNNPNDIVSVP